MILSIAVSKQIIHFALFLGNGGNFAQLTIAAHISVYKYAVRRKSPFIAEKAIFSLLSLLHFIITNKPPNQWYAADLDIGRIFSPIKLKGHVSSL